MNNVKKSVVEFTGRGKSGLTEGEKRILLDYLNGLRVVDIKSLLLENGQIKSVNKGILVDRPLQSYEDDVGLLYSTDRVFCKGFRKMDFATIGRGNPKGNGNLSL